MSQKSWKDTVEEWNKYRNECLLHQSTEPTPSGNTPDTHTYTPDTRIHHPHSHAQHLPPLSSILSSSHSGPLRLYFNSLSPPPLSSSMFSSSPDQASSVVVCLICTPAGEMESLTPPSECPVPGTCPGMTQVGLPTPCHYPYPSTGPCPWYRSL